MNAAAPIEETTVVALPIEHVVLGKNYRTRHPANWEQGLDELGASMKEHGQLEPVLVRTAPKQRGASHTWEVIFGERRWRAAKKAGLPTILAIVRAVPDDQVLDLQLAENGPREDAHPLDEADAFAELMKRGRSLLEIAAKRGRDVRYVRERLELTKLHPKAAAALDAGDILFGHALLLCRIPEKLQPEALKEMAVDDRGKDDPEASILSVRAAGNLVREKYMLKLATAPFDRGDAALVPKAGACTVCPKRTGNQGELFGDVKSPDVCTDPSCFRSKLDAVFKQAVKAGGKKVAPAKDVQFSKWSEHISSSKWVSLDDSRYVGSGNVKIRTLVGKEAETALAQNPHTGAIVELVSRAVADKAAKSYQASKTKKKGKGSTPAREKVTASEKARRAREAAKAQAKDAITLALGEAVASGFAGSLDSCEKALGLMFADLVNGLYDGCELLVKRRGLLPDKGARRGFAPVHLDGALAKLGKELPFGGLVGALLETFVLDKLDVAHKPSEQLVASALKLCGVDRKKVEDRVVAELKAKQEAEKAAPASKPKAKKAAKKKGRK